MVSRPTRGTSLRFTTSSVSRRTVQRERPSGGGPQARATMRCRCCASNKAAFPGLGRSYKARSGRLADSAGWSATPSSELTQRSWRLAGPSVPRPFAVRLVRAARFARAAARSAAGDATPDVPVSIVEPEIAPSCPSYKLRHGCQQVSTCITVYVVTVVVLPTDQTSPLQRERGRACGPQKVGRRSCGNGEGS